MSDPDPLVPRVVRRHLGDPSETEAVVEDAVERQVALMETLPTALRIQALREQAHAALDAQPEDPKAVLARIGVRHRAAVLLRDKPADNIEVIYSDGGVITENDVARLLEPRLGAVRNVRFVANPKGAPNVVLWSANNASGERITGHLLLHATLRGESQLVSWAEIVIDEDPVGGRVIHATESDAEVRLRQVANQARATIERVRRTPDTDWRDVVSALVAIVEVTEK